MKHQQPSLNFLGATDTVTGSRYLIDAGGRRVLVDCGLFQGYKRSRERNRAPFPVPPRSIDAVVLTHAHLDHTGYVPRWSGTASAAPCTPRTAPQTCASSSCRTAATCRRRRPGTPRSGDRPRTIPPLPLYTAADAVASLNRFKIRRVSTIPLTLAVAWS